MRRETDAPKNWRNVRPTKCKNPVSVVAVAVERRVVEEGQRHNVLLVRAALPPRRVPLARRVVGREKEKVLLPCAVRRVVMTRPHLEKKLSISAAEIKMHSRRRANWRRIGNFSRFLRHHNSVLTGS